ncbi:MAG: hypothetical protein A2Y33_10435 [Spirochaetes bacterium GWF1_51_8]|nr:MAG: hypothetical protein A2Y33_10435 [Spirochaetes bacterium GWF1_51_8]
MKKTFALLFLLLPVIQLIISCDELIEPKDIMLLVKDDIPPVITLTSHTNNQPVGRYYTLGGNVSDVGRGVFNVWIKKDTGSFEKALVSGNTWAFQVDIGYAYAVHTYYVYAEDKSSNFSKIITNSIKRVQIPSVQITNLMSGTLTNTTNIVIYGVASIDSPAIITNISVQVNGGIWIEAINNSGDWTSWYCPSVLSEGYNAIIAKVFGNTPLTADSGYFYISNDLTPPVFVSVNYTDYQKVFSQTYQLQLVYNDAISGVSNVMLQLNNRTNLPMIYSSPYWITNVSESTLIAHIWKYYAYDRFYNISATNQTVILRKDFTVQEFVPYYNSKPTNFISIGFRNCFDISSDGNTFAGVINIGNKVVRIHWNGSIWVTNYFAPIYIPNSTYFGMAIALSSNGNDILIGDQNGTNGGANVGYAYLQTYDGTNWVTNLFLPTNRNYNPGYGCSVDISADGKALLIGSCWDGEVYGWGGAVYFFRKNGMNWETNKFIASDVEANGRFGSCVSLSADGNIFLVGSYIENSGGANKVYVFRYTNSSWIETNIIAGGTGFSYQVKLSDSGNAFVVVQFSSQTAYYYRWNGSTWTATPLTPHDFKYSMIMVGYDCAISADGNTVLLSYGNVYRFHWNGSSWTTNIINPYLTSMTGFGQSVACSPDGKNVWVYGDKVYKFVSEW